MTNAEGYLYYCNNMGELAGKSGGGVGEFLHLQNCITEHNTEMHKINK